MKKQYEHTEDVRLAQEFAVALRARIRKLRWIAGGYENMGMRELDQCRLKLDELEHWLSSAIGSLNCGAQRRKAAETGEREKKIRPSKRTS